MSEQQSNTVLRVFRIIHGRRVPYHFELDPTMTVVIDRPEELVRLEHKQAPVISDQTDAPTLPWKGGEVEERTLPNGGRQRIYKPSPHDITVGTWVTEMVSENPIPGTDDLRAAYFKEHRALLDKHAEKGTKCPSCEEGALIRKFRAKLEAAGYLK